VTGTAYVDQQQSWRLGGFTGIGLLTCGLGNYLSLDGTENHARIWHQLVTGTEFGAWFISASYETACVYIKGTMRPLDNYGVRQIYEFYKEGLTWHCIDGSQGSIGAGDGYNRGALDFVDAIQAAAESEDWDVSVQKTSTPSGIGEGHAGTGVSFNGTVYIVTVDNDTE
jgi:hypothetical protein